MEANTQLTNGGRDRGRGMCNCASQVTAQLASSYFIYNSANCTTFMTYYLRACNLQLLLQFTDVLSTQS